MLVVRGMQAAFIFTKLAGQAASFQDMSDQPVIRTGSARRDLARGLANIGAVQIEPDALFQWIDIVLTQAGIRAGDAGLRTVETMFDAGQKRAIKVVTHVRVRGDHLLNMHDFLP
jgi:hypothetical protein